MLLFAIPWIVALFGFYVSDVPGLRSIFRGGAAHPGRARAGVGAPRPARGPGGHAACHHRAAAVARPGAGGGARLRTGLSLYLGLMLSYGVLVAAQDGWNEQLIKRGLVCWDLP